MTAAATNAGRSCAGLLSDEDLIISVKMKSCGQEKMLAKRKETTNKTTITARSPFGVWDGWYKHFQRHSWRLIIRSEMAIHARHTHMLRPLAVDAMMQAVWKLGSVKEF